MQDFDDNEFNIDKSFNLTSIQLERIRKNREAAKRIKLSKGTVSYSTFGACELAINQKVSEFRTAGNKLIHVSRNASEGDELTVPVTSFASQYEEGDTSETVTQPIGLSQHNSVNSEITNKDQFGSHNNQFVEQSINTWYELRLPEICVKLFKSRGIQQPYPWQLEFLKSEAVRRGNNLVYALPTSAGKTFVAEVLLLRSVLGRIRSKIGVKCLMVLPFVSLVKEKAKDLEPFGDALSICVESFHGYQGKFPLPQRTKQICIATIEKADRIIKELIEENRMAELALVVVDEAHFVAEKGRGPLLELLLSRILTFFPETQIVAMSATMPNLNQFCNWMQAKSFESGTRPIDLKEYVKCGCHVLELGNLARTLPPPLPNDPDHLELLVKEALQDHSPVIIFCATKASTEIVAKQLTLSAVAEDVGLRDARNEIILALRSLHEGFDSDTSIFAAISVGVAFHHSGLSSEERQIIEDAYKSGLISVLVATTTLAAGVNLPAGRVIVRTPYTGREFLTASRFKQMAGRAGRAGLGQKQGDAFLFVQPGEKDRAFSMVMQGPKEVESQLMQEAFRCCNTNVHRASGNQSLEHRQKYRITADLPAGEIFLRSILGFISAGRLPSRHGTAISVLQGSSRSLKEDGVDIGMICNYFNQTLMCQQLSSGPDFDVDERAKSLLESSCCACRPGLFQIILNCLEWLLEHKFLSLTRDKAACDSHSEIRHDSMFYATSLGKATYLASIAVEDALLLYNDLEMARGEGIILVDQLHLLYLIAPVSGLREPNWSILANKISKFDSNRKKVLERIGIQESFVCLSAQGRMLKRTARSEEQDFKARRLWVAMLLQELVEEKPVAAILRMFGAGKDRDDGSSPPGTANTIDKGYLEELQSIAASFASMVAQFSRNVGFEDLASLVQSLTGRIANGARSDILPLCEIPFVQVKRAREMFRSGLRTVEDVASAKPHELVRMLGNLLGPTGVAMAKKIIQGAQMLHRRRLVELAQGIEISIEEEDIEMLS